MARFLPATAALLALAAACTPAAEPAARRTVPETPVTDTGAEGAAAVVRAYFGLIEAGRPAAARRLWSGGGDGSGKTEADFAADLARYAAYRAEVGAPGAMEGAAGSSYVEVPVRLHGRLKDGSPFSRDAVATLRRVNDVPGATAEQRRWHITDIADRSTPEG
ncbi:MAG: hypothetical protein JOZ90_16065 [Alphaproteobacteria bacterium]|nr:hypothetical protein [Alphaproteobacteria bacterium]MBV9373369.1 hypothetical protein [Alphaproteobacteria bacterium]MBV9902590.1 hypothetical protein [Alphaproteobacteria bacterium]